MKKKLFRWLIALAVVLPCMIVAASAATQEIALDVTGLESDHNYANNTSKTWNLAYSGAKSISLTFDAQTSLESNYDFLYVYDANGNQQGKYSGTSLAGTTITVTGDAVQLKLTSDNSVQKWGFKVTSATALVEFPDEVSLDVTGVESAHNYANNESKTWTLSYEGATSIVLTFDAKTKFESNYDFLYIYDANNAQVGKYSGTELAGVTITVDSDSVTLKMTSDYSNVYWGFKVTSAVAKLGTAGTEEGGEGESDTETGVLASGSCGSNLTWKLYDSGELVISGTGAMYNWSIYSFMSSSNKPWAAKQSKIKTVTIEDGVTGIGEYAFEECYNLTTVNIGAGVTSIGKYTDIEYCAAINVSSANTVYSSQNGVMFNKDKTTLLYYPSKKADTSYVVPASVTQIDYFPGKEELTKVEFLGDAPTTNPRFSNCTDLSIYYHDGTEGWPAASSWGDWPIYKIRSDTPVDSGTCGTNLTWKLYSDGELVISGTGSMTNYTNSTGNAAPWLYSYKHTKKLTSVTVEHGVTSIGDYAFYSSDIETVILPATLTKIGTYSFAVTWLTAIDLPDSLSYIGSYAFEDCLSLSSIMIPNRVSYIYTGTFAASGLRNISLGSGVRSIGQEAFYNLWELEEVTIPASVTSVSTYAFAYCSNLKRMVFLGNAPSVGTSAFEGLHSSMTFYCDSSTTGWPTTGTWQGYPLVSRSVTASGTCGSDITWTLYDDGELALKGTGSTYNYTSSNLVPWNSYKSSITSVSISEGITGIGNYLFYQHSKLTEVCLPASLQTVGSYAFYGCSTLKALDFYSEFTYVDGVYTDLGNLTSMGDYAFYGCSALTSVSLPDSVTHMGIWAFGACTALKSFYMSSGLTVLSNYTFINCSALSWLDFSYITEIGQGAFQNCKVLFSTQELDLFNSSVTSIGADAFRGCTGMQKVYLPDSVTYLGSGAFYGCSKLAQIHLPEGISSIPSELLRGCTALTKLYLPTTITSLGSYAFSECSALATLEFMGDVPGSIGANALATGGELTIVCYQGAAGWPTGDSWQGCALETREYVLTGVFPYKGAYDQVDWMLDRNGVLTFSSTYTGGCEIPDYNSSGAPWSDYNCWYRYRVRAVVLDAYFEKIGTNAFDRCKNLRKVSWGEGVYNGPHTIGHGAFSNCSSLESFYVGEYSRNSIIGDSAFSGCSSLQWVAFAVGTKATLGEWAFSGCTALREIYINRVVDYYDATIEAGEYAFYNVDATIYYPSGGYYVPEISGTDHRGNIAIQSANYGMCGNDVRWSFNASTGTLTLSGSGGPSYYSTGNDVPWAELQDNITSIVVEEGITGLPSYIFEYCEKAQAVTLPNTLKQVAYNAFNDCGSLNNLLIPASVTEFTKAIYGGFIRCESMTDLYYLGTQEEWAQVTGSSAVQSSIQKHFLTLQGEMPTCTQPGTPYYIFDDTSVYSGMYSVDKQPITQPVQLSALGHNRVAMPEITATCSAEGRTGGQHCSRCEEVYVQPTVVSRLAHTEVVDAAVEPTCGATGMTEGKHCSVCNEVLTAQEVVPATGQHGYQLDEAVEPTCTETGLTVGASCPTCDYVHLVQAVVPATGHTEVIDAAVESTCIDAGLSEGSHCSTCGEVLVAQEELPLGDHIPEVIAAVESTCTTTGLTEGSRCSVCEETLVAQEETPLADHVPEVVPAVDATCITTGLTEGSKCSVCGAELVVQEETALAEHTPVVDPAVAPSCSATGLTEGSHCGVCGEVLVKQKMVQKTTHSVVIDAPKAATCTEVGYSGNGMHCGICGEVLLAQTEIPVLGHDTIDHEGQAPTTESVGWAAYQTCSRCDYTTYKELPKLEAEVPTPEVAAPVLGTFERAVVKTITIGGQEYQLCRWRWTFKTK